MEKVRDCFGGGNSLEGFCSLRREDEAMEVSIGGDRWRRVIAEVLLETIRM